MTKQEKIGQRYDLVRSCLSGGCPEMLPKIDDILDYISTGEGVEKLMSDVERKEYKLSEAKKNIADLDEQVADAENTLEKLKLKRDQICNDLSKLYDDVVNDGYDVSSLFDNVDKVVTDLGITASQLAHLMGKGQGMTYVEVGDCIYRVTGVIEHGAKRILQISEEGYVLADNGVQVRQKKGKNIIRTNTIYDFKHSVYQLIHQLKKYY